MITAPYNFVPLNEKVFYPDWADQVSHDIPFSDGESGEIGITITAKSPIFIRNHEVDTSDKNLYYTNDKGKKISTEFCYHSNIKNSIRIKQYYIPGSSLKGMVRNVLEIMSFGRIKIDENKYSKPTGVRDMTDRNNLVGQASGKKSNRNFGYGILRLKKDDDFSFKNYGNQIKLILQSDLSNYDANAEISQKYAQIAPLSTIKVSTSSIEQNRSGFDKFTVRIDEQNGKEAKLFFGHPITGKHYEFVLLEEDINNNGQKTLDEKVVDAFRSVYFIEQDKGNEIGKYWHSQYKRLNKNESLDIPIFYNSNENKITSIGLTQLYKLPYKYTIKDAIHQNIEMIGEDDKKEPKFDLAETIFGATREHNSSLKGRVQFGHFKIDKPNNSIYNNGTTTILGQPRASYYPIYIEQSCNNGKVVNNNYKTLMDNGAKIAGWKRYPLHKSKPTPPLPPPRDDDKEVKSSTTFKPLGTYGQDGFKEFTFSGKLRYHNLRKTELGALLSALTFHGNSDEFYHNIGMAKSYGFGKIQVDVENLGSDKHIEALRSYETIMEEKLQSNWLTSPQIKELFTMADKDIDIDDKLKYLILDPKNSKNEFVDAKNTKVNGENVGKDCLKRITSLHNATNKMPQTLLNNEVIKALKEREEEKQKLKDVEDDEKRKNQILLKNVPNKREWQRAIKAYILSKINPVYFEEKHLKAFVQEHLDDIIYDEIREEYEKLSGDSTFPQIRELLLKRYSGQGASDLEKAKLYLKVQEFSKLN